MDEVESDPNFDQYDLSIKSNKALGETENVE